jgi:hypothetical protein
MRSVIFTFLRFCNALPHVLKDVHRTAKHDRLRVFKVAMHERLHGL